jgi:hypothetical protein
MVTRTVVGREEQSWPRLAWPRGSLRETVRADGKLQEREE